MKDDPKWLSEMREHHLHTGEYRIEDVERVLGDPRVSVSLELRQPDYAATSIEDDPAPAGEVNQDL